VAESEKYRLRSIEQAPSAALACEHDRRRAGHGPAGVVQRRLDAGEQRLDVEGWLMGVGTRAQLGSSLRREEGWP